MDPQNGRFPKSKTPPSEATNRYPSAPPVGAEQATSGLFPAREMGATNSRRAAPQL